MTETKNSLTKQPFALPGFSLTPTGLKSNESLTESQWEDAGRLLGYFEHRLSWYVGDWLLAGETGGYMERGKLDEACARFGIAYSTASRAAQVCRAIEQSTRRRVLSFGHHQEVSNREDAKELLDWCEETGASSRDLRAEKRRRSKEAARIPPPEGKFRVLYADPPWEYTSGDQHTHTSQETVLGTYYPSMPLSELCGLPVAEVSHDNSVLFLWTTSPLVDEALVLCGAWGFEYKTSFVWDKMKHNVGHYVSVRHELLLICTRGSCLPDSSKLVNSVQHIERGEHSEKPEKFYDIIESMYTSGPYIELFARNQRKGWKSWGNQLPMP